MKVNSYVNEEKRTCVVVISDCEDDVIRKVHRVTKGQFKEDFYFRGKNSWLAEKFIGKAKCAPEDEFDSEFGLDMARARAFAKYNAAYDREIDTLLDRIEDMADAIDECRKQF